MTIINDRKSAPQFNGQTPSSRGDEHPRTYGPNIATVERRDERFDPHHAWLTLAWRVLGTWEHTARLLAIVTITFALFISAAWMLHLQLDLGPLHLGHN